jgi:cell fate regulator YaaT (PSP1 superfamily)
MKQNINADMLEEMSQYDLIAKSRPPSSKPGKPKQAILVRYGKFGLIGLFRHSERTSPHLMSRVVLQTNRGLELGEIISRAAAHNNKTCTISDEKIDSYVRQSGPNYPLSREGRVVRLATMEDLNEQRHIDDELKHKMTACRQMIRDMNLPMKLVEVEHLLGGEQLIFYFKSDQRVDFRSLVRSLRGQFKTHIKMQQIGARDEARLMGDCDTCGRELCCKKFLKVLQPVNIRMAKNQKLPLDRSKISGACGRLKCCIRYENVEYNELKARLPKIKQKVLTEQGPGIVLDTLVLTQLVKVKLIDSNQVIALNVDELKSTPMPARRS